MNENDPDATPMIRVWDFPTRLFHWSLVVMVALAYVTSEAEGAWFWIHLAAGYGILGLVVFRGFWGFLGTRYARFANFVRPWPVVREHIGEMLRFQPSPSLGHTPPGGWMIVALLVVLVVLVASGLFAGDDDEMGPLASMIGTSAADAMGEVHEALNSLLWGLVTIHVAAVVFVSVIAGDNLIRAMWTGRRKVPAGLAATRPEDIAAPRPVWLVISITAAVVIVLAVA